MGRVFERPSTRACAPIFGCGKICGRALGSRVQAKRLALMPRFRDVSWRRRLRVRRWMVARFAPPLRSCWRRESSSKAMSSTPCWLFSIDQCLRIASARGLAWGGRLLMDRRDSQCSSPATSRRETTTASERRPRPRSKSGLAQKVRPDTNCRVGCAHQHSTDCGGRSPPYNFWAKPSQNKNPGRGSAGVQILQAPRTTLDTGRDGRGQERSGQGLEMCSTLVMTRFGEPGGIVVALSVLTSVSSPVPPLTFNLMAAQ